MENKKEIDREREREREREKENKNDEIKKNKILGSLSLMVYQNSWLI